MLHSFLFPTNGLERVSVNTFQHFKAEWLLFVPLALTIKRDCFFPTDCIRLFRMILTISSDYSINLLVFVTETQCFL
jgi:hypothetical protein